jgi:hypothetical protein
MGAAAVGKILGIVGGVASAVGTYRNELARSQQLRFDAQVTANNAELARQDQMIEAERGAQERAALTKQEQQVRGEGRVGYAAGNIVVDTGTPLEFDIAQAEQFARERETSRDEQALAIQRLETERQSLLAESRLKRRASRSAKRGGAISAVGGFLQSLG